MPGQTFRADSKRCSTQIHGLSLHPSTTKCSQLQIGLAPSFLQQEPARAPRALPSRLCVEDRVSRGAGRRDIAPDSILLPPAAPPQQRPPGPAPLSPGCAARSCVPAREGGSPAAEGEGVPGTASRRGSAAANGRVLGKVPGELLTGEERRPCSAGPPRFDGCRMNRLYFVFRFLPPHERTHPCADP